MPDDKKDKKPHPHQDLLDAGFTLGGGPDGEALGQRIKNTHARVTALPEIQQRLEVAGDMLIEDLKKATSLEQVKEMVARFEDNKKFWVRMVIHAK